jgi:hypothetical protein
LILCVAYAVVKRILAVSPILLLIYKYFSPFRKGIGIDRLMLLLMIRSG